MTTDLSKYFLPYQQSWILCDAPLAIGEKSRRIGWTYASSYRAVDRRLRLGTDLFYTSADLSSAREFVEDCQLWARIAEVVAEDMGLQVVDEEGLQAFVLRFENGSKIVAGSSSPKFFRGKGGDADADEFAFHNNARELFKAMHATALVWGHQIRIWSTHNGEASLFNTMIKEARGGRLKADVQSVTILDAVEQGLVERIRKLPCRDDVVRAAWLADLRGTIPDEDTWAEEYMCKPSSEQSSLLSYAVIAGCELEEPAPGSSLVDRVGRIRVAESIEDLPTTGSLTAGFDVGRKKDLSVLWVLERVGDVYWTRLIRELANVPFTQQEALLDLMLRNRAVRRLCIDSTGLGMMLAERLAAKYGTRAEAVNFSAPVKAELAMPLLRLFQDRQLRIPARAEVREDLHKIRKTVTAAGNVRFEADRDEAGHADRFWALALAAHAADSTKVPLPPPLARKPVGW